MVSTQCFHICTCIYYIYEYIGDVKLNGLFGYSSGTRPSTWHSKHQSSQNLPLCQTPHWARTSSGLPRPLKVCKGNNGFPKSYHWYFKERNTSRNLYRLKGQELLLLSEIKSTQVLTHVEQKLIFFALHVFDDLKQAKSSIHFYSDCLHTFK